MMSTRPRLPIDDHLEKIRSTLGAHRSLVLVAAPGAGKTTRVAPALCAGGPVMLLQPRRVAARAIARRIATENGWRVGAEVGWQVRMERCFTRSTRVLVVTEGILTARLQDDPLLSGFATVILDEFHERSLHADLALALSRQAAEARGDLGVVVMSATLDPGPVAQYLGGAPVIRIPGRTHPVEISHAPGLAIPDAIRRVVERTPGGGHVLAFLPGAGDIHHVERILAARPDPAIAGGIFPLHGSLDADRQDAALRPAVERKVILATNLAETSLTVEGVTDVIDSGRHKVLRYDPDRGLDRLEVERISRDSAEQRAGRAGRERPGRCLRLWDPREELPARREPEILRVDLCQPVLQVLAWGGDPQSFPWFDPPPPERLEAALTLLGRLGALEGQRLSPLGERLRRFPLHPRLARVLVASGGGRRGARACAVLSEPDFWRADPVASSCDVTLRLAHFEQAPETVRRSARALEELARSVLGSTSDPTDEELRRALLAGYPDRVARRREVGQPRFLLASGTGARLARVSGVLRAELVVAVDLQGAARGRGDEAWIRMASEIERDWIEGVATSRTHRWDPGARAVRAVEQRVLDQLVLAETAVTPDPDEAGAILVRVLRDEGLPGDAAGVLHRLAFAGIDIDLDEILHRICRGHTTLPPVDLDRHLPPALRHELDRRAPATLRLPSGRPGRLRYPGGGEVVLEVKLQELFGLAETPRVGPSRIPVTLHLLSPAGRPVQVTRDLRSFWERTYPEVRKELRGRYPRHPWPEDPWNATPTSRVKPRGR